MSGLFLPPLQCRSCATFQRADPQATHATVLSGTRPAPNSTFTVAKVFGVVTRRVNWEHWRRCMEQVGAVAALGS